MPSRRGLCLAWLATVLVAGCGSSGSAASDDTPIPTADAGVTDAVDDASPARDAVNVTEARPRAPSSRA